MGLVSLLSPLLLPALSLLNVDVVVVVLFPAVFLIGLGEGLSGEECLLVLPPSTLPVVSASAATAGGGEERESISAPSAC